jgi:hypothetical protein
MMRNKKNEIEWMDISVAFTFYVGLNFSFNGLF